MTEIDLGAAMRELRIVVEVAEIEHGRRVDPVVLERLGKRPRVVRARPAFHVALDLADASEPAGDGAERRVRRPGGRVHHGDELLPVGVVVDRDRDPAFAAVGGVATTEDAVRRGVARAVADARWRDGERW